MSSVYVIVPSWNAADSIAACLDSLTEQTLPPTIVVVDNGSADNSVELIKSKYKDVVVLEQSKNLGFAGGVNVGIKYAIEKGAELVALFNNDAAADKDWLKSLSATMSANNKLGIVTGKLLSADGKTIDSTGECYSIWGLPFPRGRGEPVSDKYDTQTVIFGASGGASLYKVEMLKQIGLFDEVFFAYYEDIDLSFRAQLAGWQVAYQPAALAYHETGSTSAKIKGFRTYQTIKNLPLLGRKNMPAKLLPKMLPRFLLAYFLFYVSAVSRGDFWPATKGWFMTIVHLPKNIGLRRQVQKNRQVSVEYINKMIVHDLPPDADRLRSLRSKWWQLTGRRMNK